MRDPDGPWRHGSVYIYVWDLTNRVILFHAGFPNQYEGQPLKPVRRDAVTGELILPQLIEAVNSGPEGGFVEYHFDDPNDDADSPDIPKIGIERAAATTGPVTAFSLGGASRLSDALQASGQALANGAVDLDRLLADSSFTMPFTMADHSASGGGANSPFGQFTLWGSGDYRGMSGGSPQSVDYDGSVTSANLGIDTRLGADLLAGVAMSWSRGAVDYKASGASGDLTTQLLSFNPYLGWQMPSGMNLWSMAGYGFGKLTYSPL